MNLEQSYQRENRCYQRAVRREVTGIALYYEAISRKEVNRLLREWNTRRANVGIHAIIVGDKIIQTLPWEYKGRIKNDRVDSGRILILIVDSKQEGDAESVYENTIKLCALLCKQYGLSPQDAIESPDRQLAGLSEEIEACIAETTYNKKKPFKVMVTAYRLNVRMGPSVDTPVLGIVKRGDVHVISEQKDNWGKLKSKQGYISLAYTKRI